MQDFQGDDTKALSRSSGLLGGLASGFEQELKNQEAEKVASIRALRQIRDNSIYSSIPGKDIKPWLPAWNEDTLFPVNGIPAAIAQWGAAGRQGSTQNFLKEQANLKFAHDAAMEKQKAGQKFNPKDAFDAAHKNVGPYADLSDPDTARQFENSYNQFAAVYGVPPRQLFGESKTQPGRVEAFFGAAPEPRAKIIPPTGTQAPAPTPIAPVPDKPPVPDASQF